MAKQNIKDPGAHHNSSGALIRRFLPYLAKHKAVLFLDLFCAALTGHWLQGLALPDAAARACDHVVQALRRTHQAQCAELLLPTP